jgi:hypothetical protein
MRCVAIMDVIYMVDFKQYAMTNDVTLSESRNNWRDHAHCPLNSPDNGNDRHAIAGYRSDLMNEYM